MVAQKTKTDNGKSREQLVKDSRREAQAAGGTLAEAILKHVERTADQLRYEDIAAVDKKAESNKKDIRSLRGAHSNLSRKQGELEKEQKTTREKVEKLEEDTKESIEQVKEKVTSVSSGLSGVRTKTEENATKIEEVKKENKKKIEEMEDTLGRKLTEHEVKILIGEAFETHDTLRDDAFEQKFVTRNEAEKGLATKGEINQVNDAYIVIRDEVEEVLRVVQDAHGIAVEALEKAEGANTQANGAFKKAGETDSDLQELRTSMAPQPSKESPEMPEEAKSVPGSIAVTKTEVEGMIKQAARKVSITILTKIADFAEYAETPHDLTEYIQEEIKGMGGEE